MIRRVKFENFKALRDVEIAFDERLTVLVGPNGSGKSSVLQGIHIQSLAAQGRRLEDIFVGPYDLRNISAASRGSRMVLVADCSEPGWPVGFRVSVPPHETATGRHSFVSGGQVVHVEQDWFRFDNQKVPPGISSETITTYQSCLRSTALVRFSAEQLASPSMAVSATPTIERDGGGLASTLRAIQGIDEDRFRRIVTAFMRIIRNVQGVRFGLVERNGADQGKRALDRILIDYKDARGVPAEAVSDGTLFVLGLLTVVCGSEHIRTVLCDDLDHGLHPKAQMELIRVLRELMAEVPDLQVIATSHSLYVLSELPESSIRVLTLGPDGGAVCGRLSDHPDYESWKEAMTPGEFWSHVGEDWLLKHQPATVSQ